MTATPANLLRQVRHLIATHTMDQLTDRQLLERFRAAREEEAFTLLVRRHGPMVLGVCRRVLGHEQDAEDVFQATFLVLARKSGSIRQADVGGYLYRVAYHLALRARTLVARRKQRDKRGGAVATADALRDVTWHEVRAVVDEELQRLPDALRSAVVLCYLEGKTHEEAARQLGWSKGTLRRRLDKGRELLRRRLLARGLTPAAALTATLFAEGSAPAAVSASLADAAVQTALNAIPASPAVAALAEAGCALLSVSKTKVAIVIVLTASVLGGAGLWACPNSAAHLAPGLPGESPPAAKGVDNPHTAPPNPEAAKTIEIQGRVLGPDGKPKAGAKLLLLGEDHKVSQLGTSAVDGRFTLTVPKESKYRSLFRYLIAQADGLGIDFIELRREKSAKPVELRLVKDNVIRGRVVNTEGKPIRGVRVTAPEINVHINNSLDTFLAAYIKILAGGKGNATQKVLWREGGALFAATTDADGRFALHGIGAERTAGLHLSGGGIADTSVQVVNRTGFDPTPYNQAFRDYFTLANGRKDQRWMQSHFLSGPDLSVVAETEKVIRGVVTDADSGEGQPGLVVRLTGYYDDMMPPFHLNAKIDADGRYEIHGARKAKSYLVQFMGDPVTGYTPSQIWAEDTTGYRPVIADLKVKKGVIVTGKVIDRATGKPIPGWAMAAVLSGNPFDKDYGYAKFQRPNGMPFVAHSTEMDSDGTFRLVTIPGPVLLMGGPNHQKLEPLEALKYGPPIPDPKYPKYFQVGAGATDETRLTYYGHKGFRGSVDGNFCKVLDVKPGVVLVKQDIVLESANTVKVKIQDAEGRPLSGVWATGISPRTRYRAYRLEQDSCPSYHLEAGKPRLMVFCEPNKKLAGTLTLKGDEKQPVVAKLGPAGSIQGRLLDADGKPLAGVEVDLRYRDSEAEEIDQIIHEGKQIVTDANGAFTFDELIPRLKFELSIRRGWRRFERETKPADPAILVKPGECRDLGAIKLKLAPEKAGE
jgi:RNA polymerase sigma factor (sigma-70 family)